MSTYIDDIDSLNKSQDEQIKKLHAIVEDAITEEALIIDKLEHLQVDF